MLKGEQLLDLLDEAEKNGTVARLLEEERDAIGTAICEESGYDGFYVGKEWCCVWHSIEALGSKWPHLLRFALGKTTDLPEDVHDAWNESSVQFLQSMEDLPDGIYCEHVTDGEACRAEIYPAMEEEDDDGEE